MEMWREGQCDVCRKCGVQVRHLKLYTIGSEGTTVCEHCAMVITEYTRVLMTIWGLGYKEGFRNRKEQR